MYIIYSLCYKLFMSLSLQMQRYLVLCMALLAQVSADDCPGGEACEEGNTCCKVPSDGYECCPMYQVCMGWCLQSLALSFIYSLNPSSLTLVH